MANGLQPFHLVPARTALEQALLLLPTQLSSEIQIQSWLTEKDSLFDMRADIDSAKSRYEVSPDGKARKGVSKIATNMGKSVLIFDAPIAVSLSQTSNHKF